MSAAEGVASPGSDGERVDDGTCKQPAASCQYFADIHNVQKLQEILPGDKGLSTNNTIA